MKQKIEIKRARRAIISVGNKIKSDDNIGNLVIEKIPNSPEVIKIKGGLNPENFIRPVKNFKPDVIFFLDAVDSGDEPGSVKLMRIADVQTLSPSTHNIPVSIFKKLFPNSKIFIIGIQPKTLDFGTELSPELKKEFGNIVKKVQEILSDH